ncbi:retrotransposon gag protein [Cucumis melo var. makuwa]|uniref:Retrotransposon gag protein n=1 Tax=Cucumis melo var. makuwa TaxID=1194695 RepID=A0A5D3C0X5_CUCMM|nr:retrotransposon gag protein [Cucumis melo var. makuwa]
MAEKSQNFSSRTLNSDSSLSYDKSIKEQVSLLTKLFASFVKGEVPKVASCGVHDLLGHHNDQCPELKEVVTSRSKTYQHFFFLIIITRLSQPRKEFKNNEELLVVFKKVEVNTPIGDNPDHIEVRQASQRAMYPQEEV